MRFALIFLASLMFTSPVFAQGASIEISNRSDWDIHYLYLSPSSSSDWGPDQLGNDIISTNTKYTLYGIACDTYDVMLVDEDDDQCVLGGIRMCKGNQRLNINNNTLLECQGASQGSSQAGMVSSNSKIEIYNATRWDIYQLYLSPSNRSTWGDDLLGWGTWDSGEVLELTTDGCGDYDLRMVDEDNDVCEVSGIYMCGDHGTITLTEDDLLDCLYN